jgi:uncharacterized protein (DUF427 family)
MTTATFQGTVIAESDRTVIVEGNHYFPADSIVWEHLAKTDRTTGCPWKGTASYFSVSVGGEIADNAAWTYETPKDAAAEIKDHVAFYPAVTVS